MKKKAIIMGAAGRDFHDFNSYFRDNEEYEIECFTATQIPGIENRIYPFELTGKLYPNGIPIKDEKNLVELIKEKNIDVVFLSYSDLAFDYVMKKASLVLSTGASFQLLGPKAMQLKSSKPVIAVNAVRTGCGKSQTTRFIAEILKKKEKKFVVIREPMPYGNLVEQKVMRFSEYSDLEKHKCTIEEMEEFEPHIEKGNVLFAGVDYKAILNEAEKESEIILWDGGNNEFSFYKTDLLFVIVDPFRTGHELTFHPGMANFLMADVIIINKVNTAEKNEVEKLKENIKQWNPKAKVIECNSKLILEKEINLTGKKVLVIEDGPTVTHGGMNTGAATVIAKEKKAKIIDPKPFAVKSIQETFEKYPHLNKILPAMGYGKKQIKDLEETINKIECDLVLSGTPIDLSKIIKTNKKIIRVKYDLEEINSGEIEKEINKILK